jgi:hypothetical protein
MIVVLAPAQRSDLVLLRDFGSLRRVLENVRRSTDLSSLLFARRRSSVADWDRRVYERFQHELPIHLTPVAFDGTIIEELESAPSPITALTRDLTLRGVGFAHAEPLSGDYALVDCELLARAGVRALVSLRWSNRGDAAGYSSGGRFVGLVALGRKR